MTHFIEADWVMKKTIKFSIEPPIFQEAMKFYFKCTD